MKRIALFALVTLLIATLGLTTSCKNKTDEAIKIGVLVPQTGFLGDVGKSFVNGLNLSIKNSDPEIQKLFQLIVEDHKTQPQEGVTVYRKLTTANNPAQMPVLIGTVAAVAQSIVPVLKEKNDRILITSIVSSSNFTSQSDHLYRYFMSTPDEVDALLTYFNENSIKDVSVLYVNNEFGVDAYNYFKSNFKGSIPVNEAYDAAEKDFKNYVPKFRSSRHLYVIGLGASYGLCVSKIREYGYKGAVYAFSGFGAPLSTKEAGSAKENVIYTGSSFASDSLSVAVNEFKTAYKSTYSVDADHYAGYGFDLGNMLINMITEMKAKKMDLTVENFKITLDAMKSYVGVCGSSNQDSNGDFKFKNVRLYQFKNGKPQLISRNK